MIHYIPGCDVRLNHPKAIKKIEQYMLSQGAVIDQCCRTKEKILEKEDMMVTNCTMCQIVMDETHPRHQNISLYEYILNDPSFPWVDHQGKVVTLQDCWRTRKYKEMLDAIRECLKRMNFTVIEMKDNREKTIYDGVWKYNPINDILFDVAPKTFHQINENDIHLKSEQEQVQMMKEWIRQYLTEKVVVYCNGCEKGLKLGGIHPIHLVELIAEGLV